MILDTVDNAAKYASIHPDWARAFAIIGKMIAKPIPEGDNIVEMVDGLKVVMQTYQTKQPDAKKYEGHRHCVDIQFMVKGKETIYWADFVGLEVVVPYSEERDHMSFADTENNSPLHLAPNTFAAFLPGDAHKTQCVWDEEQNAVKLIVKLPL